MTNIQESGLLVNGRRQITIPVHPNWTRLIAELTPELTAYEKFLQSQLDQLQPYPDPTSILSIVQGDKSTQMLTLKSFSLMQGKQKSKKTTFLVLAVAALLRLNHGIEVPDDQLVCMLGRKSGHILFFDCEQGESYAARTMKLILKVAGLETSEYLHYCDLREFSPTERLEIIKAGVEGTPETVLVVVDGVVDLMDDFMDAKEGHLVVTDLLKLCSQFDIHVTGVLHQNKGTSKDARAHVGSISSQKCEVEIMAEVDPNNRYLSNIHCKESRGLPFDDFAIQWLPGGLPEIVQSLVTETRVTGKVSIEFDPDFYAEAIDHVFKTVHNPKYSALWGGIKAFLEAKGPKIGDNRLKYAVQQLVSRGIILGPDEMHKYYRIPKPI